MFSEIVKLDNSINRDLSMAKKIDKLIEIIIEPKCKLPSFIMNHPTILSPLARSKDSNNLLSERLEFYINNIELINAYSELNSPTEQKERFIEQSKEKDDETHPMDEEFIQALSYGMPPTAGFGLGIDRLTMILLGLDNIKEVIFFPLMNPQKK